MIQSLIVLYNAYAFSGCISKEARYAPPNLMWS